MPCIQQTCEMIDWSNMDADEVDANEVTLPVEKDFEEYYKTFKAQRSSDVRAVVVSGFLFYDRRLKPFPGVGEWKEEVDDYVREAEKNKEQDVMNSCDNTTSEVTTKQTTEEHAAVDNANTEEHIEESHETEKTNRTEDIPEVPIYTTLPAGEYPHDFRGYHELLAERHDNDDRVTFTLGDDDLYSEEECNGNSKQPGSRQSSASFSSQEAQYNSGSSNAAVSRNESFTSLEDNATLKHITETAAASKADSTGNTTEKSDKDKSTPFLGTYEPFLHPFSPTGAATYSSDWSPIWTPSNTRKGAGEDLTHTHRGRLIFDEPLDEALNIYSSWHRLGRPENYKPSPPGFEHLTSDVKERNKNLLACYRVLPGESAMEVFEKGGSRVWAEAEKEKDKGRKRALVCAMKKLCGEEEVHKPDTEVQETLEGLEDAHGFDLVGAHIDMQTGLPRAGPKKCIPLKFALEGKNFSRNTDSSVSDIQFSDDEEDEEEEEESEDEDDEEDEMKDEEDGSSEE